MSLDVYLLDEDGECVYSRNITHNLNTIADRAGCYKSLWRPEEIGATRGNDIEPQLRQSLKLLRSEPLFFAEFNPSNGWGDYDGLIEFIDSYHKACKRYPEATIEVSR